METTTILPDITPSIITNILGKEVNACHLTLQHEWQTESFGLYNLISYSGSYLPWTVLEDDPNLIYVLEDGLDDSKIIRVNNCRYEIQFNNNDKNWGFCFLENNAYAIFTIDLYELINIMIYTGPNPIELMEHIGTKERFAWKSKFEESQLWYDLESVANSVEVKYRNFFLFE